MVKGILNRVKNRIKGQADMAGGSGAISTIGPLSSMLGPSGRVTLASLNWFYQESGRADFIEFVQNPVLIGSALSAGCFSTADQPEEDSSPDKIGKTQILNLDDKISKKSGPGTSLPYAIYPLMKRTESESDSFMIGRTKNSDMSMKDMAISKKHAAIRIMKGSFYIVDFDSTNGTRLNGRSVQNKPEKLKDQDIIALGNYEFTFLTPASLHDLLSKS